MHSALPLNILIVDDDEDDFFITSEYIQNINGPRKFITDWCFNYDDALEKICAGKYDLYLVDYRLGAKTGLDLIKEAVKNKCKEPIILLTGKGNQEIDMHAMKAGAEDYLLKSELNTEKLERSIRYAMGRYESIKALKVNEQKYRNIFEKSTDAVFVTDFDLAFVDVNPATSEIFGYDKTELLQINFYDLLANKKDQDIIKEQLILKNEVAGKNVELLTKSRQKITCIISISKEMDDKGKYYVQGIIHDITSLKKAEIASLQAEKSRAAERFARMLAHEVRNPLNNINLSIEQLDAELASGDAKIFLDIMSRNSKRINDIITELLNSSRQTEIKLSKTRLETVIDNTVAAAKDRINLKKIKLNLQYNAHESFVLADDEKLKIALLNIIINAVEAMKEDDGVLTISLTSKDYQHIISLSDNGIGISEENISKLFEPYYTSKQNGMGLGLASTLNILQAHKAAIEVKSTQGKGTTFIISLEKAQ